MSKRNRIGRKRIAIVFAAAIAWAWVATGQTDGDAGPADSASLTIPEPSVFVTEHEGTFGGRTLRYTAAAGETYLRDDDGQPKASLFTFAYTLAGDHDPSTRPVTFVWNGGPGSASIWLHMGTLGPKRVLVPDAEDDGAPPYPLESNPLTVLDVTDLVFVDPVGTGFSRALGTYEPKTFWGLWEDAEVIAELIEVWVTENRRWRAPKFLIGESFGTMRAVAVAKQLADAHKMSVNGLLLISQAIDYQGSTPTHGNLIAHLTYLPTMAATAWYHDRVADKPARLEDFLDQARRFVVDEYAPALVRGSTLDDETRAHVGSRLAWFTGLSEDYVEAADLRPLAGRFLKELLRDQGLSVGRLDGRYRGDDLDDVAESIDGDPSFYGIDGAYTAGLQDYMARDLGIDIDRPYRIRAVGNLGGSWRWRPVPDGAYWEPSAPNVARDLGRLMRRNTDLWVLVASGYYDFATPFYDAEYTFARHGIDRSRVVTTYYEAGHMMYLHEPSNEQFLADVRSFLEARLAETAIGE